MIDGIIVLFTGKFQKQRDILQKLEKAREAIKYKYRLIKFNKANTEKVLEETFKPIVDPLQELVKNQIIPQQKGLVGRKRKLPHPITEEEDVKKPKLEEESKISVSDEFNDSVLLNIPQWKDHGILDKTYGVRNVGLDLYLGDSKIKFKNDGVKVKNSSFAATPGFIELLYKKNPDLSLITKEDMNNYRQILEMTSAHKLRFHPDEKIRKSHSKKYINFIAPLFPTGSGLPRFKISRMNTVTNYKYWDDPNELVDRMRLLVAERNAGNQSHDNEILPIIEELREGGYIY